MKDLYRITGLTRAATHEQLRQVLSTPALRKHPDWGDAVYVLLEPNRRAQYDRVHHAASQIASLRGALDLERTLFGMGFAPDFATHRQSSATGTPPPAARQPPRSRTSTGWLWGWGLFALFLLVTYQFASKPSIRDATTPRPAAQPAARTPSPARPAPSSDGTPYPIPPTGAFDTGHSTTRNHITVRTAPGNTHTLVKIVRQGREVSRAFIRAGATHSIDVPLGTYELRMAYGEQWFGEEKLFGQRTRYSRADDTFPLNQPGEYWEVELIIRHDGNLTEEPISATEF